MKCLMCGNDNPASVTYCKRCGKKLNLSHQEIQTALKAKAEMESAKNVEYQARQFLVVASVLFILALTLRVMAARLRPAEEPLVFIPAVSLGDKAKYAEVSYEFRPPLQVDLLPLEPPAPK